MQQPKNLHTSNQQATTVFKIFSRQVYSRLKRQVSRLEFLIQYTLYKNKLFKDRRLKFAQTLEQEMNNISLEQSVLQQIL